MKNFIGGALLAGFVMFLITMASMEGWYKTGHIDALTGKIKYNLVTKPDSTKVWERIKK